MQSVLSSAFKQPEKKIVSEWLQLTFRTFLASPGAAELFGCDMPAIRDEVCGKQPKIRLAEQVNLCDLREFVTAVQDRQGYLNLKGVTWFLVSPLRNIR